MEPGTILAQRFDLERRVSAGGMSAVWRARDVWRSIDVAIKVLYGRAAETERGRLFREARILEKLGHPGIVRYVAHGETDDGQPYLAMEWVNGETLSKRLARTERDHAGGRAARHARGRAPRRGSRERNHSS